MPARNGRLILLILSAELAFGIAATGCSSLPKTSTGSPAVFRESASDVANRAPVAMSVPSESSTPAIDANMMREQADFHFALGEAHALDGNSKRASEEYKLALLYDQKSPSIRLRLAGEFVKQGLVSEAVQQCKLAIEIDDRHIESFMLLGGLQSALRMYVEALATYRRALEIDPNGAEAPMFIGAILAEQKKYAESIQVFETLSRNPKNASPHLALYYLGRVRLEQDSVKNRKAAERDLLASIAKKPSFVDAVTALGAIYEGTGRSKEAATLYRGFQEKHGPDAGIAESLAKIHLENQEYDEALAQLQIVEDADPENLGARLKIAFVMIEQKKYTEAASRLEEVLARAPDSDKARFYLGAVREELQQFPEAIETFEKIPASSPYYGESVVHAAYLLKTAGELEKAVALVEKGIEGKDDYPQLFALYASLLDEQKKYPKAVEVLGAATKKFPEHAQMRFFLGSMQDRVGDFEGMVSSMRKVLEIDADHVQALNFLAYSFAERNQRLDEAEKLVRKAALLQPKDGYVMDTLGWVLFKRGNFAEAVRVLESAHSLAPQEAVIAEHLGDAYFRFQLPEKAKKMYLKATEADGSPENVKKIRSKIGALERQAQPSSQPSVERLPASTDRAH